MATGLVVGTFGAEKHPVRMQTRKRISRIKRMTNVRKILCHAEFPCDRCGKPHLRMAVVAYNPATEKIEGNADHGGREELCNGCTRADRDKEVAENRRSLQQRRWARGLTESRRR